MSYIQRFGISRKSPLALSPPKKIVDKSKEANKKDTNNKLENLKKKFSSSSSTPGHDIIERNVMVGDTTAKPNKFYQTPEEAMAYIPEGSVSGGSSGKDGGSNWLDYTQDFLTGAGMTPGYGIFADGANFLLSGARAAHGALTGGDVKKHVVNMGLAGLGAIPVLGQNVSSGKLAAKYIPKTVKAAQALSKSGNIMKVGKLAGKIKKAKVGSKYLLSSAASEPYAGYTPKNVSP